MRQGRRAVVMVFCVCFHFVGCAGGRPVDVQTDDPPADMDGDAGAAGDAGTDQDESPPPSSPRGDGGEPAVYVPPTPDRAPDDGPVRYEPIDDATYLFDPRVVRTYELSLHPDALAFLDSDPRAEVYVEGRLAMEGEQVGPVGIRYKGSVGGFRNCLDPLGAKLCTKLSMKVKINWNDPNATFHGVRKLQFHAMNRDASMMRDRLGYWVFRQAGIAAPRAVHARVVLNGELLGLFALVEQIDGRFTRSRFVEGGKGNLYKEAWPLESDGSPVTEETLRMQLRTNEDEAPVFDGMLAFAQALSSAAPAERPAVLEAYTDADYLMRYLAVDRAIAHDDGPLHWYCSTGCSPHNFYFYEEPDAARLWIIAWDLDSAFNIDNLTTTIWLEWDDTSLPCEPLSNPPFVLPLRPPHCDPAQHAMAMLQERYLRFTQELLDGPMRREVLEEKLLTWEEQIYPFMLEAAATHADAITFDAWQQERARLRAAIDRLVERAQARVARGPLSLDQLLGN